MGLDPVAKRTIWERLLELKTSAGMTIFLATHDMEEADYLCDQLALLHHARLAVLARPAEFKRQLGSHASLSDAIAAYGGSDTGTGGPRAKAGGTSA